MKYLAEGVYVTEEQTDWIVANQEMPCVKTFLSLYQMQRAYPDPGGNALMVCAWNDCMKAKEGK